MKKVLTGLIILLLATYTGYSQNRNMLGFGIGPTSDLFKLSDTGDRLQSGPRTGLIFGLDYEHAFTKNWKLGTGFYWKYYSDAARLKDSHFRIGNVLTLYTYQVPMRIKYSINFENGFSVSPYAGAVLGINRFYDPNVSSDYISGVSGFQEAFNNGDSLGLDVCLRDNYSRLFLLAEVGLSFEYTGSSGIQYYLQSSWSHGFSTLFKEEVEYYTRDGKAESGHYTSTGDFVQFTIGARYPLDQVGKAVRKIKKMQEERHERHSKAFVLNKLYVGAEFGIADNKFTNSNPQEVKADDGEGFGIYFGDKVAGLILGYKATKHFGMETGIAVHSFDNDFIATADTVFHGAGYSSRFRFLEFPLRVKYYFPVHPRFSITGSAGFRIMLNLKEEGMYDEFYEIRSIGTYPNYTDEDTLAYSAAYSEKNNAILLTAGIGLEYAIHPRVLITAGVGYAHGFTDLNRQEVTVYQASGEKKGTIRYNGTRWEKKIGLQFRLGKL